MLFSSQATNLVVTCCNIDAVLITSLLLGGTFFSCTFEGVSGKRG